MPSVILLAKLIDPSTIQHWIQAGGYHILFLVLFGCGLGLPVPEDIPLIIAGYFIANGSMTWLTAAIVCWCGIIGGDMALYHIARKYGHNITRVPFIGNHINAKRLEQLEGWFKKYGILVVAVGRLFAGVRGAMVVAAGTIRYNRVKFIIADGLAALVSGGLFMLLGHFLGTKIPLTDLFEKIDRYKLLITAVVTVVILSFVLYASIKHHRKKHPRASDSVPELTKS